MSGKDSPNVVLYLKQLKAVYKMAQQRFDGDSTLAMNWLISPLPINGNHTPQQLIMDGKADIAVAILNNKHLRAPGSIQERKIISN